MIKGCLRIASPWKANSKTSVASSAAIDHGPMRSMAAFDAAIERIGPWSIAALLATLVLLFAFQGEAILKQPLIIELLAVPILIQVLFNASLAYWLNRRLGE